MELPEQPCLRSAAPVKSLLEGGALLSAVAHAGEFLGLLSPDAPGRSIMGGHPVNALNGEWRTGGAAAAAANLVAAGASAGALVLGRPSDAGESAIRAGLSALPNPYLIRRKALPPAGALTAGAALPAARAMLLPSPGQHLLMRVSIQIRGWAAGSIRASFQP